MEKNNRITTMAVVRIDGTPFVRIFGDDERGVTLVISAASGDDIFVNVSQLAQLDAIADAIYYYRMDRVADAVQAASPQISGK